MSGMPGHAHSGNKDGGRHYRRAVGLVNLLDPQVAAVQRLGASIKVGNA